ncbi:pyridoxamine 5'-phosphate oxidase family protein [Mycobacterium kansasii]|uniref:Pyridoxamine 5'-phosphate oxidase family protein n=1 Tax=Mycobacterium kansasii TaxID=1768 RepID=A0A1V3WI96_MYCKA|nr:pyridoxamine 5'-phosphate oxidase family protein [Mycobacterium kansasii]
MFCHLGYVRDGRPVVLPTMHVRCGETLYIHGSTGSGPMLGAKPAGLPVCVTATLVDGLVLARSAMHHSLNYRSVVVMGSARAVDDHAEKLSALHALLDHIRPGRAADCRTPTPVNWPPRRCLPSILSRFRPRCARAGRSTIRKIVRCRIGPGSSR